MCDKWSNFGDLMADFCDYQSSSPHFEEHFVDVFAELNIEQLPTDSGTTDHVEENEAEISIHRLINLTLNLSN